MSETDDVADSSEPFDLGDFIDEHSALFVTMGVFGALAVYISQSATGDTMDADLMIKTGVVSSFGLSVLMFVLIYSKLIDEFGGLDPLHRAHFRIRNVPLTVFSLLSGMLLLSISFILTQHEPVIFLLLITGTLVVGLGIMVRLFYGVGQRVPRTPVWQISTVFLTSLVTLLITQYLRSNVLTRFEVTTIQNLSLSDPVPVMIDLMLMLVATIQSFAALGILASIIGIPLVVFDKIRGKSPYDETG